MNDFGSASSLLSSLDRERSSGTSLPTTMVHAMEELFGADFSHVTIHTDSWWAASLGARAFAFQDQLHFASGEYDSGSAEGWRVIGHELAHVVQQRLGCTARLADTRPYVLNDDRLEHEAHVAGMMATKLFHETDRTCRMPFRGAVPTMHSGALAIQCLMDVNAFKLASSAMGVRNTIVPVDNALAEFHRLNAIEPRNYPQIFERGRLLYAACQNYETQQPNSRRLAGVRRLMAEVRQEQTYLAGLVKYANAIDPVAKADALEEAQEVFLQLKPRPDFTRGVMCLDELQNLLKALENQNIDGPAIVKRDLDELVRLINRPQLPLILKRVLQEATAPKNVIQLDLQMNRPGATYNFVAGGKKFTLNHSIVHGLGRKIRLGSLLHELIHVSVAETFGNTVVMFAIKRDATDDEMMNLAQQRRAKLVQLKSLIETTPGLDDELRSEMKVKAYYPISGILAKFVGNMKPYLGDTTFKRLVKLSNERGMDGELIEYDTVVNQMALWCYLFGVPEGNAVYQYLLDMAQEAYVYRANERMRPKPQAPKFPVPVLNLQGIKIPPLVRQGSLIGQVKN